jgi:2-polyprenyl-6-methoxyphenol hydroxylase-like FAD-dependent oxidoreductase
LGIGILRSIAQMDAAILGAGIAGLMTAIALHAQGIRCRIYERHPHIHEAGMGFILVPEGIDRLQSFGVRLTGVPLDRYCCRDSDGQIVHEEPMPTGAFAVRRPDLIAALVRALPAGMVTFNSALDNLEFDESGAVARALLSSGARIKADLYVSAEGIRSRARQALYPEWPAPQAQVLEVVGLAISDRVMRWAGHDFNKLHAPGGGIALGILPMATGHMLWFLQFDAERFPLDQENAEAERSFVYKLVGDWGEPVADLLDTTDFSRVHVWRPVDTDLVPRFHQRNLVLAGDAAHPLLPFTSQGVSSAIADAVALADLVTSNDDLGEALARYSSARRKQCAPYIAKGRELLQNFLEPQRANSVVLPIA